MSTGRPSQQLLLGGFSEPPKAVSHPAGVGVQTTIALRRNDDFENAQTNRQRRASFKLVCMVSRHAMCGRNRRNSANQSNERHRAPQGSPSRRGARPKSQPLLCAVLSVVPNLPNAPNFPPGSAAMGRDAYTLPHFNRL
jgi:hypothetical protein